MPCFCVKYSRFAIYCTIILYYMLYILTNSLRYTFDSIFVYEKLQELYRHSEFERNTTNSIY